jgi:DNA-binding SARP family transcriptional activator
MAPTGETRIQLCGRIVVRLEGRRVDGALPGALGQLLFAYLVLNRLRRIGRDELLIAVYGEEATPGHQARLSVLLSKLRRITGPELLVGRAQLELALPRNAFVDLEVALDASHRAESHVAKGNGRPPGGRPASPTTSQAGRCWEATTDPGSTIGGDVSMTCG